MNFQTLASPTRPDGRIDRRRFLNWAAALAAGTGLLGSAGLPLARAAEPFRIGWVRPTTGRLASSYASLYVIGVMAIDEINAAGGIMGRPIERVEIDDEASPAKQPGVFKKLQGDGIGFVAGPTGDAPCVASLPTASAAGMVQACFTHGTKPMDGTAFPYSYVLYHSVKMIADVCIDHFHAKGARRIGILVENSTAGEAAVAAARPSLARYKLEPSSIQVFPPTQASLMPYLANLKKADTEVILSFLGNTPSAASVLNGLGELQWFPAITGHSGLLYEALFDLAPAEALKNASAVTFKGLSFTPDAPPPERSQAFAKKLLTYPGVTAPHNIATGPFYDWLYLLKNVIEQEKSFEPARIKAALDRVRNFPGVRARISFTPENHGGVSAEELTLVSATSAKDPRSQGSVFRQRLA